MSKSNLSKTKKQAGLHSEPASYQISVHVQNMMATYGQEVTLRIIKELFFNKRVAKKEAANE